LLATVAAAAHLYHGMQMAAHNGASVQPVHTSLAAGTAELVGVYKVDVRSAYVIAHMSRHL
jgi:hypothetical protein